MKFGIRMRVVWATVLALAAAVAIAAAPRICRECGHEQPPDVTVCTHCGAKLPEARRPRERPDKPEREEDKQPAVEAAPDDGRALLDASEPVWDVEQGRGFLTRGDRELARLFFRNALALNLMTQEDGQVERGGQVSAALRSCEPEWRNEQRDCPVCRGSGRGRMPRESLRGGAEFKTSSIRKCPACNGSGKITAAASMAQMRLDRGRASNRFATLQQARGRVPVGGAWAPARFEAGMTIRQRIQIARISAVPCATCMGFGRLDCPDCKGGGLIPCPNRGCVDGTVEVKAAGRISQHAIVRREQCPMCQGRAVVSCETCQGQGRQVCKECEGSGERPACKRCGGQGGMPCPRCAGTGKRGTAKCANCGGQGVILCASCNGDGRSH